MFLYNTVYEIFVTHVEALPIQHFRHKIEGTFLVFLYNTVYKIIETLVETLPIQHFRKRAELLKSVL